MTKKKTSIEKLETRNETVMDFQSAHTAARWKWREVRRNAFDLFCLMSHTCGFCALGCKKADETGKGSRCGYCPTPVKEYCQELEDTTARIEKLTDAMLDKTMTFLSELKEPETEA